MYHLVKPTIFITILVTVLVWVNSSQISTNDINANTANNNRMKAIARIVIISSVVSFTFLYFTDETSAKLDDVMQNIIKTEPGF